MTLARALRLFLAATLLAAWQGALVHPLEHVDEHGGFVHLSGGHDGHDHDDEGGPGALCDAIAAVAACIDGRLLPAIASSAVAEVATAAPVSIPRGAPPPAYRSQAPPRHS